MKIKHITVILLLTISPFILNGQGWENTYGDSLISYSIAADLSIDRKLIIASNRSPNSIMESYFFEVDSSGALTTELLLNKRTNDFITTSDGNMLVSSTVMIGSLLFSYTKKIDNTGQDIWEYLNLPVGNGIDDTEDEFSLEKNLLELADGGFLSVSKFSNSQRDGIRVTKLSNSGALVWERIILLSTYYPAEIIESPNGEIYVVGKIGFNNIDEDIFLMKLDSMGNTIWTRQLEKPINQSPQKLLALPDGNFLIGGQEDAAFGGLITTLLKFNSAGEEIWYKQFPNSGIISWLRGLEIAVDDGIVFSGTVRNELSGPNDVFLTKVDSTGNLQWSKRYGRSKDDSNIGLFLHPTGYYLAGDTELLDDSYDVYVIKTDSLGNSLTNQLSGNIYHDENLDCQKEAMELAMEQWIVTAQKGNNHFYSISDSNGNYSFTLDSGTYEIIAYPISDYWSICNNYFDITFSSFYQNEFQDIGAQAVVNCPLLDLSIGTSFLRRCFPNTYTVNYCNLGTLPATDAYVEVTLDSFMTVLNTSIPISNQQDNMYSFDLGDIDINECGNFTIDVQLGDPNSNCDSIPLGLTHCVEAHIFPDTFCLPTPNWSGASIEVDGNCQGDSIFFTITNVGSAPTNGPLGYIIIEDDVILYQGNVDLNINQNEVIGIATNGSTFRLEVDQVSNHPGLSMPSVGVEGCIPGGNNFTTGFVNAFPPDDGNPFNDIDCETNIGAYDPNDKQGFPLGYYDENYINPDQTIDYKIRFQNTGTDTAFNIVIKDELSELLDFNTIRPGASSHPYNFNITQDGVLEFEFNNIMLPDSNINEIASHGFVKFRISPIADLPLGTEINNSAAIFFDFNPPILTNETWHTLGEPLLSTVSIDETRDSKSRVKVYPNPFQDQTTISIEGIVLSNSTLQLYNLQGQLMLQDKLQGQQYQFHEKNLVPGVYFFTIMEAGQIIVSGKLIRQ